MFNLYIYIYIKRFVSGQISWKNLLSFSKSQFKPFDSGYNWFPAQVTGTRASTQLHFKPPKSSKKFREYRRSDLASMCCGSSQTDAGEAEWRWAEAAGGEEAPGFTDLRKQTCRGARRQRKRRGLYFQNKMNDNVVVIPKLSFWLHFLTQKLTQSYK